MLLNCFYRGYKMHIASETLVLHIFFSISTIINAFLSQCVHGHKKCGLRAGTGMPFWIMRAQKIAGMPSFSKCGYWAFICGHRAKCGHGQLSKIKTFSTISCPKNPNSVLSFLEVQKYLTLQGYHSNIEYFFVPAPYIGLVTRLKYCFI